MKQKKCFGRTPDQIKAVRPLKDGVIADFTATQLMLKNILMKVCQRYNAGRPRVVVGVPSGITEVEERAVEETVLQAGAREVYLIEEPMAAAIGASLEVAEPTGSIIVDIGGGTTEVAVISLGGIVISHSLRIAGDELDEDIVNYIKREMNLAIGETTAEEIKMKIGCAMPLMTEMSMEIRGRDLSTGLPRTIVVRSSEMMEALEEPAMAIVDAVHRTLEQTPPENITGRSIFSRFLRRTSTAFLHTPKTKAAIHSEESPAPIISFTLFSKPERLICFEFFIKTLGNSLCFSASFSSSAPQGKSIPIITPVRSMSCPSVIS